MSLEIQDFQATLDRLMDAAGAKNQSELAKILNMSKAGVNHSIQRSRLPLEWILKAHYTLGVNARYVLDGELPKHVSMRTHSSPDGNSENIQAGNTVYVQIPVMDNFLDDDGKFINVDEDKTPYVFFPRKRAKRITNNIDGLLGMFVASQDMEPTLFKNDLILINKEDCRPEPNGLYLFSSNGFCFVRRIVFIKGKFYIQNEAGTESEAFEDSVFTCKGKVVAFLHYTV